MIKGKVSK